MLETLKQQPPDALLALIKLYNDDPRPDKIDLGVGVYRTHSGATPVFTSAKQAEKKLWEEQDTKAYLGPEGDLGFVRALMPFIFGEGAAGMDRVGGMQTPGGTGAVRLALATAQRAGAKRVHMGTPSWPNHAQIVADLGMEMAPFTHAKPDGTADLEAALAAINGAQSDDVIMLHACCHNPTGVDYTPEQWDAIADALADSPALAVIDMAYQGLGRGMEEDAYGARRVRQSTQELLIAYSCDKNFGLYRDRVGAIYIEAKTPEELEIALSNGASLARANWSMPPDHGAAVVRMILDDADMYANWREELTSMRERIRSVRERLAAAGTAGSVDLTPLGEQNGMFAILPLSKEQVLQMREDHAVYMAGSGRINVAGLHDGNIDRFVSALADVTG